MPALGAFLRDTDAKIAGIPQCHALGTTLGMDNVICDSCFKGTVLQRNYRKNDHFVVIFL